MFTEFYASVPPKIANEVWIPTAELSTLCETAVTAITLLDATAGLLLAPLTAFLLRIEAESSSKIESVEAPQIDLARAALGIRSSDHAKSTVAAADAIEDLILSAENRNPADSGMFKIGSEVPITHREVHSMFRPHRLVLRS